MVNKAKMWFRERSQRSIQRQQRRIVRRNLRVPFLRELIRRTMMARLELQANNGTHGPRMQQWEAIAEQAFGGITIEPL